MQWLHFWDTGTGTIFQRIKHLKLQSCLHLKSIVNTFQNIETILAFCKLLIFDFDKN